MTLGALNLETFVYFSWSKPFRDLIRSSGSFATGDYDTHEDADGHRTGWLEDLPNGQSTTLLVRSGGPVRTGTYFIDWEGPLTVTLNAATGVSDRQLVSPNRYSFEVTTATPGDFTVSVANASGAAADLTAMRMFHEDDEASLNAGDILTDAFKASVGGAQVLRLMDPLFANGFGSTFASITIDNFRAEGDASWGISSRSYLGQAIPPSVCGRIGAALQRDIWITIPPKCTVACMQAMAQLISAVYPAGYVYVEYGNELWNSAAAFSVNQAWVRDVKAAGDDEDGSGSPLTLYNADGTEQAWQDGSGNVPNHKIAAGQAHGSLQAWKAFEDVFGNRVIRVLGVWNADTALISSRCLEYVDPGILNTGSRLKDLLNNSRGRYATAPYFELGTTDAFPAVNLKSLCEAKSYLLDDADWLESMEAHIDDTMVTRKALHTTLLASKAPNCQLTTYECGQHLNYQLENDGQGYSLTANTTGNTLDSAGDISAAFDDGEQIRGHQNSGTFPVSSLPAESTVYVKRISTTELELYSDAALTSRLTVDTEGTFKFDNYTRVVALDTKIKGIFNGAPGRTIYEYYFDTLFGDVELFSQYVATQQQTTGSQWGLKPSPQDDDADYPRAEWFREFTVTLREEESSPGLSDEASSAFGGGDLGEFRRTDRRDIGGRGDALILMRAEFQGRGVVIRPAVKKTAARKSKAKQKARVLTARGMASVHITAYGTGRGAAIAVRRQVGATAELVLGAQGEAKCYVEDRRIPAEVALLMIEEFERE